jgi:hypothetical protein
MDSDKHGRRAQLEPSWGPGLVRANRTDATTVKASTLIPFSNLAFNIRITFRQLEGL